MEGPGEADAVDLWTLLFIGLFVRYIRYSLSWVLGYQSVGTNAGCTCCCMPYRDPFALFVMKWDIG